MADDTDIDTDLVIRLRILDKLTKVLSAITVTYGTDSYDMTDKVFRGRVIFGDNDPIPMFSILEVPIPLDQLETRGINTCSAGPWELMIQGFLPDDKENPTDPGHVFLAAVKQALAAQKTRGRGQKILGFERHVTDMKIGAGVVRPPDEISAKAYFWLNITLDIVENWEDPLDAG